MVYILYICMFVHMQYYDGILPGQYTFICIVYTYIQRYIQIFIICAIMYVSCKCCLMVELSTILNTYNKNKII